MSSGSTAQDPSWKPREQAEEANYACRREQEQLAEIKEKLEADEATAAKAAPPARNPDEIEGGYGGQEDLEDRYATTYGAH